MQKFNPAAVAASLAKFAAANRAPTVEEQISNPTVWAEVEKMQAMGFTRQTIAEALVAAGIEGKATSIRTTLGKIASAKAKPTPPGLAQGTGPAQEHDAETEAEFARAFAGLDPLPAIFHSEAAAE